MTELMIGFLTGGVVGAAVTGLIYELGRRTTHPPAELTDDDRDVIAAQFAQHSQSMRQQVSHFADGLAGNDPVLRERLRAFEAGDPS